MNVVVFTISTKTRNEIIKFYLDMRKGNKPPYSVFQANNNGVTITLYESNKLMFQGSNADIEAKIWIATEEKNSGKKVILKEKKDKKDKNDKSSESNDNQKYYNITSIGSDEVGTGDYFGPIVVSSCYVKKDLIPFLEEIGVNDSKKLTDEKILNMVPKFLNKVVYKSIILSNEKYNEIYSADMNMNKIKAILHNNVLLMITKEVDEYDMVIVDEFSPKKQYFGYLKEKTEVFEDITFLQKAESKNLAVACASLISRYIFLKNLEKLGDELGVFFIKGAGSIVDDFGVKLVTKYGYDILKKYAKLNFNNTLKIVAALPK